MKDKVSRQSRAGKVRVAEDQGGKAPRWPDAGWPESQELQEHPECPESLRERESFVLRTYIVGGIGEKKLHIV